MMTANYLLNRIGAAFSGDPDGKPSKHVAYRKTGTQKLKRIRMIAERSGVRNERKGHAELQQESCFALVDRNCAIRHTDILEWRVLSSKALLGPIHKSLANRRERDDRSSPREVTLGRGFRFLFNNKELMVLVRSYNKARSHYLDAFPN